VIEDILFSAADIKHNVQLGPDPNNISVYS
jgi:hypothetical protein